MGEQLIRQLDWRPNKDPRNLEHDIGKLLAGKEPVTKLWDCDLDLVQIGGSCVSFALGLELASVPEVCAGITPDNVIKKLHWPAQREDEYPGGVYPGAWPQADGTSLTAVLSLARKYGACDTFEWAFTMRDIQLGISHSGAAIVGTGCYQGMMQPDRDGFIHPTGRYLGGHGYLLMGVDMEHGFYWVKMAWDNYAPHGLVKMTFADFDLLRRQQGECAFLVGRHEIDLGAVELPPERKLTWWEKIKGFFAVAREWES